MKINIELDITPDEFKELLLPGLAQQTFIETMQKSMLDKCGDVQSDMYKSFFSGEYGELNPFMSQFFDMAKPAKTNKKD